jgi:hypothetical protein
MTNWSVQQTHFVQDDIPTRLKTLATHLAKIQSFSIDSTDFDTLRSKDTEILGSLTRR